MTFGTNRYRILTQTLKGLAVALASFIGFGTVAALWENPLFIRYADQRYGLYGSYANTIQIRLICLSPNEVAH